MRKSMILAFVAISLYVFLPVPQASAIEITVGTIGSPGNSFPFGTSSAGSRYQQVYNNELFPLMQITGITFFNSEGGSIYEATYTIHLSTTSQPVNGLDTVSFSNNVGADDQLFWTGSLSGNPGASFTFTGPAFTFNPANGNLLMDIFRDGGSQTNTTGYFDAMNGNFGTDSSRAHDFGSGFEQYGLVTRFSGSPVPLPGAVWLLGSGLLGLVGLRRKLFK